MLQNFLMTKSQQWKLKITLEMINCFSKSSIGYRNFRRVNFRKKIDIIMMARPDELYVDNEAGHKRCL